MANKAPRVTNVQIPGEDPKKPEGTGTTTTTDSKATDTGAGSPPPAGEDSAAHPPEGAAAGTSSTDGADTGAGQTFDIEALRAEIRAEEMAKLQDELAQQLHATNTAASTVLAKPGAAAPAQRSKSDYRNMRAADVDPATLTAPVLTLDGYVCPVAPEKK